MRTFRARFFAMSAGLALFGVVLVFVFGGTQPRVEACGPFFERPVFVGVYMPDPPLAEFAGGRLGHVRPTWARRYLTVAYRYLTGKPLSIEEQRPLSGLQPWRVRVSTPSELAVRPLPDWLDARGTVPRVGSQPKVHPLRPLGKDSFESFWNCNDGAFSTAAATLRARSATFGPSSDEVADWVRAQDQVFSNCSGGRTIPEPLPASAPLLARQDRAYQIAAALFYSTDYEEAERAFRAIAQDRTSPWSKIAPYLAARCLIRKATVNAPAGSFDKPVLERASRELHAFAQSADSAHDRAMAEELLGFVDARVAPIARARALASAIEEGHLRGAIWRALFDYTFLLDAAHGEGAFEEAEQRIQRAQTDFERLVAWRSTSDLTDWIITFQASTPDATAHAFARWRESASLAWLVAVLDKTTKDTPDVEPVLEAARALKADSPAYPSAVYHLVRLQLERGQQSAARESIDRVLATKPDWPHSALNELAAWRMTLARDLQEFIRFAPRVPAASGENHVLLEEITGPGPRWRHAFDVDSTAMFNYRLPLSALERVATSPSLPETLREEVGRAAWTRAVLLRDDAVAQRTFEFIERAASSLKSDLIAYRSAKTASQRQRAALFLLLKLPGLRPSVAPGLGREPDRRSLKPVPEPVADLDPLRDNWWCDAGEFSGLSSYRIYRDQSSPPPAVPWPAFLDDTTRTEARGEDAQMEKLPTAPVILCDRTVEWAKAAPNDPRIPEALYLAIRSSHYGCWTKATTASSRAAFRLLKTRYANTESAKKTKYYY